MKHLKRKRGIVLITVLFMTVFLVMFASAVVVSTLRQQKVASVFYQKEAAGQAARAGINYAMSRLNQHYNWRGCTPNVATGTGSDYTTSVANKLDIREHVVDGNNGAVEGKIAMGDYAAYFDIYFVKPDDAKAKMQFFNNNDVAGPMPEWIPVSLNNNTYPIARKAIDSDGNDYRAVPGNAILLVCRGRVGNQTKTVETLFNLNTEGNYDSVMIGKGDINIDLNGGKLKLDAQSAEKPPIMRSNKNISISQAGGVFGSDYVDVSEGGGGKANGSVSFNPIPARNVSLFQSNSGVQDASMPPLKYADVTPSGGSSMASIPPGIYKVIPNTEKGADKKYPLVTYYPTDDASQIQSAENPEGLEAQEDPAIRSLINSGVLSWDEKEGTLFIKKSLKVGQALDISSIRFTSSEEDRLAIKLDSTVNKDDINTVYFINENDGGAINVDGELSGIGTVISKGDINMEAESQLASAEDTGISIFAEGSINIYEISKTPKTVDNTEPIEPTDPLAVIANDVKTKVTDYNMLRNGNGDVPAKLSWSDAQRYSVTSDMWSALKELGLVKTETYTYTRTEYEWWDIFHLFGNKVTMTGTREYVTISSSDIDNAIAKGRVVEITKINKLGKKVDPRDSVFRGLVFACKDFNVYSPNTTFNLEGGLVAYGGIPGGGVLPGDATLDPGKVNINAKDVILTYNTSYLSMLQTLGTKKIDAIYWTSY